MLASILRELEPGSVAVPMVQAGVTDARFFARLGIQFDYVDTSDVTQVESAIRPETKLIWLESPTNPLLKLADIAAIARIARPRGILTLVDNTFASPYFQRPLELGADIALYSTTKFGVFGLSEALRSSLAS